MERNKVIEVFAVVVAEIQKEADILYYKPEIKGYIPKEHKNDDAGFKLNEIIKLQKMCEVLDIKKEVWDRAYEIYDFRNSGKDGYGMVDGKIVYIGGK